MKKKSQNSNIKKFHIKKVSKVNDIEDIFMLTTQFKKSDNEELIKHIKADIERNKDMKSEIKALIKKNDDPNDLKENISRFLEEDIENKYQTFKEISSEKRKKGEDTFIADLKIMFLQYKLKLFKSTHDKKDYLRIKKTIKEIEEYLHINKQIKKS